VLHCAIDLRQMQARFLNDFTSVLFDIRTRRLVTCECWTPSVQCQILLLAHDSRKGRSFCYCPSSASLSVLPHSVNTRQNRCQEDLNTFALGQLEETARMPSYYMDKGYPTRPEIQKPLPEWSNWRGSESSTLETDVYIWRFTLLVVIDMMMWYDASIHSVQSTSYYTHWPPVLLQPIIDRRRDNSSHRCSVSECPNVKKVKMTA